MPLSRSSTIILHIQQRLFDCNNIDSLKLGISDNAVDSSSYLEDNSFTRRNTGEILSFELNGESCQGTRNDFQCLAPFTAAFHAKYHKLLYYITIADLDVSLRIDIDLVDTHDIGARCVVIDSEILCVDVYNLAAKPLGNSYREVVLIAV